MADIAAVEVTLTVVPDPGNNNNGSATWTYSVADGASISSPPARR